MIQLATINTTKQIPAGTYTFEWVINFTDSSGIIFNLMALSLSSNLKSVSVSFSPSPSEIASVLTGNNITWYLYYSFTSTTTITSIEISVSHTKLIVVDDVFTIFVVAVASVNGDEYCVALYIFPDELCMGNTD